MPERSVASSQGQGNDQVIQFVCPACGQHLKVPSRHAGRRVKCGECQAVVVVPARDSGPSSSRSVAPPPPPSAAPAAHATADERSPCWHYIVNGQRIGPVSLAALRQKVSAGQVGKTDLVWQEGTNDWVEAASIPAFAEVSPTVTDYRLLPWYRRSGLMSVILVGGLVIPLVGVFFIPFILAQLIAVSSFGFICVVLVTGDVYYNQLLPDGTLRKWHAANKVVAALVLLGWLYSAVKNMF